MMSLLPSKQTASPQKNFFVVCLVFLFVVFFGLLWYIAQEKKLMGLNEKWGSPEPKRLEQPKSPEARLRAIATETKSIVGTIDQITTLKTEKTRFLKVRAFVIDQNRLSEVDASATSSELPMMEEIFEVVVNEKTNMKSGGGIETIQSGDFVSIVTAENIFDAKRLTAVSVEKFNGSASSQSDKKTQP